MFLLMFCCKKHVLKSVFCSVLLFAYKVVFEKRVFHSAQSCLLVLSGFWMAHESPHIIARVPQGLSDQMGTECEAPHKQANRQRN